jgi:hypothetical protein
MRALRAFIGARTSRGAASTCELCGVAIASQHDHVLTLATQDLTCACHMCALLFDHEAAPRRRVVRQVERLDIAITDAEWASLGVPVGLAFFVRDSGEAPVHAEYPSPSGRVRSELPAGAWSALEAIHPELTRLPPATQAFVVERGGQRLHRLSIDLCYELCAEVRRAWSSGGESARVAIERFYADLDVATFARARPWP